MQIKANSGKWAAAVSDARLMSRKKSPSYCLGWRPALPQDIVSSVETHYELVQDAYENVVTVSSVCFLCDCSLSQVGL